MANVLEVQGLTHRYDDVSEATFQNVDLTLGQGEFLAVLGSSGSGKSTFLRSIAGLEEPLSGTILLNGTTVFKDGQSQVAPERRGIGMVFQDYALFPSMTVRENILFGVRDRSHHERVLVHWTGLLKLDGLLERLPASLSGGQQQRVALARALAPQPKLLLLDEPFANLDGNLREEVSHELREIFGGESMTVILVTHDRSEAFALADRIAVFGAAGDLKDGSSLKQLEKPTQLYRQPLDREVAELTGHVSFVAGEVQAGQMEADCSGTSLPLRGRHEGAVDVLVRPDDVNFVSNPEGRWTVSRRVYSGGRFSIWLSCNEMVIRLHTNEEDAPALGEVGELHSRRPLWAFSKVRDV